jgi:hypothetical protein
LYLDNYHVTVRRLAVGFTCHYIIGGRCFISSVVKFLYIVENV